MMGGAHWAAPLVGVPYAAGAAGPQAFDCWGLVRWVLERRHGVVLPHLDDVRAAAEAAHGAGWSRVQTSAPWPGDVALLHGSELHCGVAVYDGRRLRLLHACRVRREVVADDWAEAVDGQRVELWRC